MHVDATTYRRIEQLRTAATAAALVILGYGACAAVHVLRR